jgi:hypothetical protein
MASFAALPIIQKKSFSINGAGVPSDASFAALPIILKKSFSSNGAGVPSDASQEERQSARQYHRFHQE